MDNKSTISVNSQDVTTHLLVVCDFEKNDDFLVEVKSSEDVNQVVERYNEKDMQRVMEVQELKPNKKYN